MAAGPLNLMLINVSTRKFAAGCAGFLDEGGPADHCDRLEVGGLAPVRGAVGPSRLEPMEITSELIQTRPADFHPDRWAAYRQPDLVLSRPPLGIDGNGDKHPLRPGTRGRPKSSMLQALIDNLIERGLDPSHQKLFIIDGAKALSKVTPPHLFGGHTDPSGAQITIRPAM